MTTGKRELGRNDPCWCGSGRLYKHCHRREDLEAEKQAKREAKAARAWEQAMAAMQEAAEKAQQEIEKAEPQDAPPMSPEMAAAHARWEQFETADLESKIAIFQATLDSGEMDAEEAFEMTQSIRDGLDPRRSAQGREGYGTLIEQLRRQAPDLYRHDVAYYASNMIDDAVAGEQWSAIPELLTAYAQNPEIDMFLNVMVDQLMYHGQTRPLREAMEQMWPAISSSEEIMPWGVDEFAGRLLLLILLDYLETAESPQADDPMLREATAPYGEYRVDWAANAIEHLNAPSPVTWQPADFDDMVDADRWSTNLQALLFDFMAAQCRHADVPYGKSMMMHQELGSFLERQLGMSEQRPSPGRARKKRSKSRRREPAAPAPSSLVPRRAPLDRFLVEHFGFMSVKPYRAGVVVELLPAYLHFLAAVGAVHPTKMDAALKKLQPLANDVRAALEGYGAALHLIQAIDQAWSEGALTALREDPALAKARAEPPAVPSPSPEPVRRPGSLQTFRFKVTYLRDPEVWRVIEIAEHQTLDDLHYAIQSAVDFDADHLYSFYMSNQAWDRSSEYASPHAGGPSATGVKIGDLRLRMKQRFLYLFDYGDEHHFEVQLVATDPDAPKDRYPKVVDEHGQAPSQYGWWEGEEDWDEEWDDEEDWDEEWDEEEDWEGDEEDWDEE